MRKIILVLLLSVSMIFTGCKKPNTDTYPTLNGVDDIIIVIGSDFTVLSGITATDVEDGDLTDDIIALGDFYRTGIGSYVIDYQVTDSSGNITYDTRNIQVVFDDEPWEMNNSEFVYDEEGWEFSYNSPANATFGEDNGIAELNITNIGTYFYDVNLYQDNKEIDKDTMYLITFRAKVDIPRTVRLGIEDTETVVNSLFLNLAGEEILFDLTTEWVTYEYTFDPTDSCDSVRFALGMGNITGLDAATLILIEFFTVTVYIPD